MCLNGVGLEGGEVEEGLQAGESPISNLSSESQNIWISHLWGWKDWVKIRNFRSDFFLKEQIIQNSLLTEYI